ncbi:MarR family transcriptional regulator [Capsulimonas corticalis]|uniref:MarR family transcriptional regulator n=1 Tax=Capsulimonas corticalis TaxID=2219043 RepID=A0A402CUA6_9BACT|nr:MarR family winged helix-turn-helix transcriptional regulator [Capsulimonas corticalis]BDI28909.1 MarR family transcriptional regulator [Capsulimonas corticalis]
MSDAFESHYGSPNESPGFQLWRVSNLWQRQIRKALQPFELTHVQYAILTVTAWLSDRDEPMTQAEIARLAGTDEMMTSQVVRALEARGLLSRERHRQDFRAFQILVTDAGREMAESALKCVESTDEAFFTKLGDESPYLTYLLSRLSETE